MKRFTNSLIGKTDVIATFLLVAVFVLTPYMSTAARGELEEFKTDNKKLENNQYVEGEVLVKFKDSFISLSTETGPAETFARNNNIHLKDNIETSNLSVYRINEGETVAEAVARLGEDQRVEYAEPNYKRDLLSISTNDTYKSKLWGLFNSGQLVNGVAGKSDADIDAPEAWAINQGTNGSVIIAVIDTGVAYNHPDLHANMWNGTNCKTYNGHALGNCNHGYDFADGDRSPLPTDNSHGTHVAGTIAAVKNNNKGIVGVAPRAKIMAIRFGFDVASEVKAISFAINNKAKVINASYGGSSFSQAEYDAIEKFKDYGGLFIAAAGNGGGDGIGDNNETAHYYPTDYDLDNIISVAATTQNDNRASFSNYGTTSVDVGAPGVNIYSTEGYRAFDEDFEGVTLPGVGSKFTQTGDMTWGTLTNSSNVAAFGDYANWGSYQNNMTSIIDSSTVNISGKPNSYLNFYVYCDSESGYDGVALYFWNGSSWVAQVGYSGSVSSSEDISLKDFAISDFRFRFVWIADSMISGVGCYIDDIKVIDSVSTNGSYQYLNGTSMAAPHVAGLAALIMGYNPDLNIREVKEIILESGDELSALKGRTVSGRRINAQKALLQAKQAPTLGILMSQSYDTAPWIKRVNHHGIKIKTFKVNNNEGGIASVQADINGDGINEIVVAPDAGLGAKVKAYTKNGTLLDSFSPFGSSYNNGISIAAGDVNNDGKDEIIVAPLTKGTPKIRVYRYSGGDFRLIKEKSAFGSSVPGGLNISSGDVNGDGIDEIIVSPYQDKTKNDRVVKVYAYRGGKLVQIAAKRLYGNHSSYQGIMTITADMNGDGKDEIVATPSLNYGDDLEVYSYDGGELSLIDSVKAYSTTYSGITSLAAGDINNDGNDEIALAIRTGGQPYVFIYKLNNNELSRHDRIRVYESGFIGGVNVTALDVDNDNKAEIITAPYSGKQKVKVWDVESSNQRLHSSFWGFSSNFDGGINFSDSSDSPTLNGKRVAEVMGAETVLKEVVKKRKVKDTYFDDLISKERSLLTVIDGKLSGRLAGNTLLQVERNGEGWYVYPGNNNRYFLGRPSDAFDIMRNLGLGATHEFITSHTEFPDSVVGKILLDVEFNGEAYYIYPGDRKAHYLGRPDEAFKIMCGLGLGITNTDIRKIGIGEVIE